MIDLNKEIPSLSYFVTIKKYIKVPDKIKKLQITELPFILVKRDIIEFIRKGDFNSAVDTFSSFFKLKKYDRLILFVHLLNEYDVISKMEMDHLHSKPSEKMIMAGISELNKLGVDLTIWNLANNNITEYNKIANSPYKLVFSLQYKLKKEADIKAKIRAIEKLERDSKKRK